MTGRENRPLVWLHAHVKSPPLSAAARIEAGKLLRRLQYGELLGLPQSRPMPVIAARCHELRVSDAMGAWRVIYRLDEDAVVVVSVFRKTTEKTPFAIIKVCRQRLRSYDTLRTPE